MKNLLLNREYNVVGNWYEPAKFLREKFKSVINVDIINTTSSAGDWSGLIFQKIGKNVYAIAFSQENNYPLNGFTINTGENVLFQCLYENFNLEMRCEIINEFVGKYYQ